MKIVLKTNWKIMHKPLIVCCVVPFVIALLLTVWCIIYPSPHAQDSYTLPIFCLKVVFLLVVIFYFIFVSIRISFDGDKLTFYKFFLPVKSFSIRKIESVEYSPQTKYLFINRKYAFVCRLFPKKDIDELLEILSQSYGIKTGKI